MSSLSPIATFYRAQTKIWSSKYIWILITYFPQRWSPIECHLIRSLVEKWFSIKILGHYYFVILFEFFPSFQPNMKEVFSILIVPCDMTFIWDQTNFCLVPFYWKLHAEQIFLFCKYLPYFFKLTGNFIWNNFV